MQLLAGNVGPIHCLLYNTCFLENNEAAIYQVQPFTIGSGSEIGNVNVNVDPSPSRLSTLTCPP